MAWVTLDEADDDPHAFCCAVATALMPELNAQAVGVLHRVTADAVERDDLPRVMATALRVAPVRSPSSLTICTRSAHPRCTAG
jgi:hypothetical protein